VVKQDIHRAPKTVKLRALGFIERLGTTCIWSGGGDTDIISVFVMYTVTGCYT
jgi:hypothetical protein